MAINVNTVYQTVLLILNKEQRGLMTPLEFNKIGAQVQLEIFERYFEDLNQQIRIPQTDTDYADRVCRLYTSDAADDLRCVDLGGRRIIKKKKHFS